MLSFQNLLKALNGLGKRHIAALHTSKLSCHKEWLRQESLHLTGSGHHQLILLGQFIHTQNGDDVLQFLVALQDLLHASGRLVMLLSHDSGIQNTG